MDPGARIDDLFRLPLDQFIAARNALAKTLTGEEGKRVRALAKPTVVPWAVNQVYWRARKTYDRLIESGARVRQAQTAALKGRAADVRAANDAHRRAMADAVREAERFAIEGGSHPSPDGLMRTFEALSLASEPPEPHGRLTHALQPAGFEALAGIVPKVRLQPDKQAAAAARKREAARKKEEAGRKKHEAAVRKAEAALERAKAKMQAAEAALRRTRDRSS